ncbi:hypothetical protein AB7C87_12560 [Natrarchaeobius sp. A-rgal3]|uniref:hypothetical protein n=1 Tax=Natrarchaeobius versutus TaxID=1679078 RepID=UPI00350FF681
MTDSRITRRGVIALTAVGLAGCAGSDERENGDDDEIEGIDDGDDEDDSDGQPAEPPERDITVDWDEAPTFRTWLLRTGSNSRFDYTATFPDGADPAEQFPAFFGLSAGDVDAHLIQTGTHLFFGSFDTEAILDGVQETDGVELTSQYEGYAVVTEDRSDGPPREIAVGGDAIIVGPDYERRIDASRGDHDRLEELDPEFTHLFRELPHETTVSAQYGGMSALEVDDIYCWGVSSESPSAETMTWVFVFATEPDSDVLSDLEEIAGELEESTLEGRTATVVGSAPEVPRPDAGLSENGR